VKENTYNVFGGITKTAVTTLKTRLWKNNAELDVNASGGSISHDGDSCSLSWWPIAQSCEHGMYLPVTRNPVNFLASP
jgi:hypothetical protein